MFEDQAAEFLLAIAPQMRRLLSYARLLCGSYGEEPEELLQETILVCHRRITAHGFQGGDSEYIGYLFTQLKYRHLDLRRQRLTDPLLMEDATLLSVPEEEPVSYDVDTLAIAIHTYLHAHYSAKYVEPWELFVRGLSYQEIAFAVNEGKATVYKRIQKVKEDLQREFASQVLA